jgi:hypothetical protein
MSMNTPSMYVPIVKSTTSAYTCQACASFCTIIHQSPPPTLFGTKNTYDIAICAWVNTTIERSRYMCKLFVILWKWQWYN